MPLSHLFLIILIASMFSFGGLGSLPVLQSQLAANGVSPDAVVLPALAVGNISPGPNGLYLVAASYFMGGIKGSLIACLAVAIPPFLVLPVERAKRRLIHLPRFRAMLRSLALAVVALLVVTDWSLITHAAANGPRSITVMVVGTLALLLRVPPLLGVVAAIAVGIKW
jgi:chromate transporter